MRPSEGIAANITALNVYLTESEDALDFAILSTHPHLAIYNFAARRSARSYIICTAMKSQSSLPSELGNEFWTSSFSEGGQGAAMESHISASPPRKQFSRLKRAKEHAEAGNSGLLPLQPADNRLNSPQANHKASTTYALCFKSYTAKS